MIRFDSIVDHFSSVEELVDTAHGHGYVLGQGTPPNKYVRPPWHLFGTPRERPLCGLAIRRPISFGSAGFETLDDGCGNCMYLLWNRERKRS